MKVLFVLTHLGFFRNFEQTIRCLLDCGDSVDVFLCKQHETIRADQYELIESAPERLRIISSGIRREAGRSVKDRLRFWRDIVHYLQPDFRENELYWERLQDSSKQLIEPERLRRIRNSRLTSRASVRKAAAAMLRAREWWLPADELVEACVAESRPDIVVVSPLVGFHSQETDFVKVARQRRIPSLLAVASWDNLVNKGAIKIIPDRVAVWNEAMAAEAVRYHGVPEERIVVTGAPPFDPWFGCVPSRNRERFFRGLGLDPGKPTILYLCSSASIVGYHEHSLILKWMRRIRNSPDHPARDANVLVRPHPMNLEGWAKSNLDDPALVVWPPAPIHPTSVESRNDFFDSLYHADVIVGLNTSAMIEAAILGRPVLCFSLDEKEDSLSEPRWQSTRQRENLHLQHLVDNGFVRYANSLNRHAEQLSSIFSEDRAVLATEASKFVRDFVRPSGLDVNSSWLLAHEIREVAMNNGRTSPPPMLSRDRPDADGQSAGLRAPTVAQSNAEAMFAHLLKSSRLRTVKLEQLFPGISRIPVEIGVIDPDTGHPNHVDMLYVAAIARLRRARSIFEFGTYLGRTTYHLALGNEEATVHTLDLKPEMIVSDQKIGGAIRNVIHQNLQGVFFRDTEVASRIRQLHGDTRTFDYAPFRGAMDFIFIDAGHLYDFVRNDTSKAFEMLAPGGVIIWHDFAPKSDGVVNFIADFLTHRPLFHIEKTSLLLHIDGVDPVTAHLSPAAYDKRSLK